MTFFFWKSYRLWDNVEKYGGAKEATVWHMRDALWISKATGRTHTRTHAHTQICSTFCFSAATMVSWTRLSVTLYLDCRCCLFVYSWGVAHWNSTGSYYLFIPVSSFLCTSFVHFFPFTSSFLSCYCSEHSIAIGTACCYGNGVRML